jgi:hypothetical protein
MLPGNVSSSVKVVKGIVDSCHNSDYRADRCCQLFRLHIRSTPCFVSTLSGFRWMSSSSTLLFPLPTFITPSAFSSDNPLFSDIIESRITKYLRNDMAKPYQRPHFPPFQLGGRLRSPVSYGLQTPSGRRTESRRFRRNWYVAFTG